MLVDIAPGGSFKRTAETIAGEACEVGDGPGRASSWPSLPVFCVLQLPFSNFKGALPPEPVFV